VVARTVARSGRLSSLEVGANVVHLFSNAVNQEQGNTIVKDQGPSSSKTLSPFGYNDLWTKVMKDIPSSSMTIGVHRNNICNSCIHSYIYIYIYIYFMIYK
jgi:hypothetical protein